MRFKELLEYKRDITTANLGEQLVKAITSGAQSSVGNTIGKLREIIPGIEISSDRSDDNVTQIMAALGAHFEEVLKFFEDADPTTNKQYTEWIIRRYIDGGIRYLEDVDSTVAENLAIYHELKTRRMLPPELMDINKFKGSTGTNSMMRFFRDVYNIYRELPEQQAKIDKGEVEQVYEDDEIRIVHPEDQTAACYYGQGTRWCTASTKSRNYFDDYNSDGPLYIVLPKKPKYKGEKYQLHFESFSFMNENDETVNLYRLTKRFPQIHKLFHDKIVENGQEAMYRGEGGATALLADPETLENWEDIVENEIKPRVLKWIETPESVYDWLGLKRFEQRAKVSSTTSVNRDWLSLKRFEQRAKVSSTTSAVITKEEQFLLKKKIKWINKIAEHISENKDQVMSVIDRTIGDLDEVNQSLSKLSGGLPNKAMTAIPTMYPGTDTMETDIGDRYVSSNIRIQFTKEIWSELALLISPYFNDSFEFMLEN